MASKKNFLGMLVMLLVFGMLVAGCAAMAEFEAASLARQQAEATDGKGGTLIIRNTSNFIIRYSDINQLYVPPHREILPGGRAQHSIRDDGEVFIRYRIMSSDDRNAEMRNATQKGEDESSWPWGKKSIYVSGEGTFEITIP